MCVSTLSETLVFRKRLKDPFRNSVFEKPDDLAADHRRAADSRPCSVCEENPISSPSYALGGNFIFLSDRPELLLADNHKSIYVLDRMGTFGEEPWPHDRGRGCPCALCVLGWRHCALCTVHHHWWCALALHLCHCVYHRTTTQDLPSN